MLRKTTFMTKIGPAVQALPQDRSGGVALLFGLTAIILLQIGGGVLDVARAHSQKTLAQQALDSSVLTLMSNLVSTNNFSQSKTLAEGFISQNMNTAEGWKWDIGQVESTGTHMSVVVTGTKQHPTYFLRLIGIDNIPLKVQSHGAVTVRPMSVAVVPDISWSMNQGGRMAGLKAALTDFSASFFSMSPLFLDKLQLSMVPYAGNVNISKYDKAVPLLTNWEYGVNPQKPYPYQFFHYLREMPIAEGSIRRTEKVKTKKDLTFFVVREFIREKNNWKYTTTVDTERPWTGCLQVKESELVNDDLLAKAGSEPMPPTAWAGVLECPPVESRLEANIRSKAEFDDISAKFNIGYGTSHDIGMLWALRVLSPNWATFFGLEARPWNSDLYPKYVILLSDGQSRSLFQAGDQTYRSDPRTTVDLNRVCTALKDKGVTIIGITYEYNGYLPEVEDCASPEYAYHADTLNVGQVFKEIAEKIKNTNTRLTH